MKRLSDFKPLRLVVLPDVGTVSGSGLTLIVGPNSAGKTRFLNDLYSRLCGYPQSPVVATRIELNKPEYQPLIECLADEGYIRISPDQAQAAARKWFAKLARDAAGIELPEAGPYRVRDAIS
jgi:hypothetical protein